MGPLFHTYMYKLCFNNYINTGWFEQQFFFFADLQIPTEAEMIRFNLFVFCVVERLPSVLLVHIVG